MATFRNRGTKKDPLVQVQIRRKDYPYQNKSFNSHAAAKSWARKIESEMDDGTWVDTSSKKSTEIDFIVSEWLKYQEVELEMPVPRGKLSQVNQIGDYFKGQCVHTLTESQVLAFCKARRTGRVTLKKIKPSTMQQQLSFFKQIVRESKIKLRSDPIGDAYSFLKTKKKIHGAAKRKRLMLPGEYALLSAAAKSTKHTWIMDHVDLALATGMRQGEIHALRWEEINWKTGIMTVLRKDKNELGGKRKCKVPMVKGVREVLLRLWNKNGNPKIGTLWTGVEKTSSVSDKFAELARRAGIVGLRYHDLRHESLTQISRYVTDPFELQLISGHRNINELLTYVRRAPEELVADYIIG